MPIDSLFEDHFSDGNPDPLERLRAHQRKLQQCPAEPDPTRPRGKLRAADLYPGNETAQAVAQYWTSYRKMAERVRGRYSMPWHFVLAPEVDPRFDEEVRELHASLVELGEDPYFTPDEVCTATRGDYTRELALDAYATVVRAVNECVSLKAARLGKAAGAAVVLDLVSLTVGLVAAVTLPVAAGAVAAGIARYDEARELYKRLQVLDVVAEMTDDKVRKPFL